MKTCISAMTCNYGTIFWINDDKCLPTLKGSWGLEDDPWPIPPRNNWSCGHSHGWVILWTSGSSSSSSSSSSYACRLCQSICVLRQWLKSQISSALQRLYSQWIQEAFHKERTVLGFGPRIYQTMQRRCIVATTLIKSYYVFQTQVWQRRFLS